MNSQLVFGRGSTQVLGNMPFQSELATGSALHETDRRLDEIAQSVSGLNRQITYIDSTRPTRTEIHGISGNYATHTEVRDWAKYASGNAATYADTAIAEASGSLVYEIDQLEEGYKSADTVVLSGAEKYARDLVRDTSAALKTDYGNRFTTEANARTSAVAAEHDRASAQEYRIEDKFNDWCATISGNLGTSAVLLNDEDIRINGRIDTYQQTFSAVLDDVSATAYEALEENDFHNFIDSAGVQYEKEVKTMYLGKGVKGNISLSANGDIVSRKAMAGEVRAGNVFCSGTVDAANFIAGSGTCVLDYNGGDTIYFTNSNTGVEMAISIGEGNVRYGLAPAILYADGQVGIGKPIPQAAPVSRILIGGATSGNSGHENCVVISPPTNPAGTRWWPKGSGTIAMYTTANPVEDGIYIGPSALPQIITKYAASKAELEQEVLAQVQNASGAIGAEIHSGLWQETNQLVSGAVSRSGQNLSAYVNEEAQKRIDAVQSVRDELPRYLPAMGGTILGSLAASALNVFDAFSGSISEEKWLYDDADENSYFMSGIEIRATLLTPMAVLEKRIASGIPADSVGLRLDIGGVVYYEDPETHVQTISGDYHYSSAVECQYDVSTSEYRGNTVEVRLDEKTVSSSGYPLALDSHDFTIDFDCAFRAPVSIVQYVDERTDAIAMAASTLQEVADYLKSINEGD